jgi:small subunit ribosomal protein S2
LRRERRKILRNLEGIRGMKQLPACLVVVDIRREHIAVREARKMQIPVVALVDTDCNPEDVDIVIPGNDDAYRSIQVILKALADSLLMGRRRYEVAQAEQQRARHAEEAERRQAKAPPSPSAGGAEPKAPPGAAPEKSPQEKAPAAAGAPESGGGSPAAEKPTAEPSGAESKPSES